MDAERFRALADRCRELSRVAERDDIRRQLRQWEEEFEMDAETAPGSRSRPQEKRT
jgi:hypothetical protein